MSGRSASIVESAEIAGECCAGERLLHRLVGESVRRLLAEAAPRVGQAERSGQEPARADQAGRAELAGWLSAASMAHAWRAELFAALLPVSVGLPEPGELVRVDPGREARWTGLLAGRPTDALPTGGPPASALPTGPPAAALLDALLDVIYPELRARYGELAGLPPVSDAPLLRALRRVVADMDSVAESGSDLRAALRRPHDPPG